MNAQSRAAKRFKRENRPNKGVVVRPLTCRACGHKLTCFGCPNCSPSLGSIGLDMLSKGEISPEQLMLTAAIAARRS